MRKQAIQTALEAIRDSDTPGFWCFVERSSMIPTLRPGDAVWVESCDSAALQVGDIVAYQRDGVMVVHRLIAKFKHWLLTQGDHLACCDAPVPHQEVIGRLTKRRRRQNMTSLTGAFGGEIMARLQAQFLAKGRLFVAALSSAPFAWSWRELQPLSLNFAGVPLLLMLPKSLIDTPLIARYRQSWSRPLAFQPWIVEVDFESREGNSKEPSYQLNLVNHKRGYQIFADTFTATVDEVHRRVRLKITQQPANSLENCLRALIANVLHAQGGFLLHASAVVHHGKAYVFFGPSGSGKSTIAAQARQSGDLVLSDDLVALVKRPHGMMVEGVPFQGSHPHASCASGAYPLAGLLALNRQGEVGIRPLKPALAVTRILAATPFLRLETKNLQDYLQTLDSFGAQVACKELSWRQGSDFWQIPGIC